MAESDADTVLNLTEETGQAPSCMYCDSKNGNCRYLVAVIDNSFSPCDGGELYNTIDKLRKILSCSIMAKLSASEKLDLDGVNYEIRNIILEAIKQ